jgi:hypothetical protein
MLSNPQSSCSARIYSVIWHDFNVSFVCWAVIETAARAMNVATKRIKYIVSHCKNTKIMRVYQRSLPTVGAPTAVGTADSGGEIMRMKFPFYLYATPRILNPLFVPVHSTDHCLQIPWRIFLSTPAV